MDIGIQDFRLQLRELLNRPLGLSSQGVSAAKAISQQLESETHTCPGPKQVNPLSDVLQQVSESAEGLPTEVQVLVNSVIDMADFLIWYKRSAPHMPEFMEGHANAEIIGPRGLEVRDDIIVGVTIMRSGITYPDHHHPPEEVYLVLSEGFWRQNDNPWKSPGPGGYVYNPPNIIHAMKSVETPLFAIWCLKP